MPKDKLPNQIPQPEQPFVLSREELSDDFEILTPEAVEQLGLTKKTKSPEKRTGEVTIEQAAEILVDDFLGPDAVKKTFGFKPEHIPPIPFTIEDLERAKELGQFLILRVSQTEDGNPLDMVKMHGLLQPEFTAANQGKILKSYGQTDSWYRNEDFLKDVPRSSWALVSKDVIPNSLSNNFLQQTEVIADYLKTDIFKDQEMPEAYKEAIEEFEAKKAGIQAILTSDWQEAAKQLSELRLNQLTRQLPVETMYDFLMCFKNNKKRLLEKKDIWTYRRASDGQLVLFGLFDAGGADVGSWSPGLVSSLLGVSFSRSH